IAAAMLAWTNRPRGKCPIQRPTKAQSSGRMPRARCSPSAHASSTTVAPMPMTIACRTRPTIPPSEERPHAEADAAARQRSDVLEERRVHARFLVEQVAAVEEHLPGVAAGGVRVPGQVRV